MYPKSYQRLIEQFLKFPTVGPRTAGRFVSYLTKLSKEKIEDLIKSIQDLRAKIKFCSFCFNPYESSEANENLCQICSNHQRDKTLLCLVEKETDLISIEKTKKYKGLYFILGGTVSTLKKADIEKLRIKELEERIKNPTNFGILINHFQEIILALNPTTEGEATTLYLEKELKPFGIKVSHLARGLPVGGELEYADEETLGSAFEGRR